MMRRGLVKIALMLGCLGISNHIFSGSETVAEMFDLYQRSLYSSDQRSFGATITKTF